MTLNRLSVVIPSSSAGLYLYPLYFYISAFISLSFEELTLLEDSLLLDALLEPLLLPNPKNFLIFHGQDINELYFGTNLFLKT